MTKKHKRSSITTADLVAEYFDQRDEQLMQALVTAGAFVALADGYVKDVERHELVSYVDGNDLVPTIAQREIIEAFDNRVREIEDRGSANVIVDALATGRTIPIFIFASRRGAGRRGGWVFTHERGAINRDRSPNRHKPAGQRITVVRQSSTLRGSGRNMNLHAEQ